MMPIAFKLAWREIASTWSRFVYLFLCITLGVGAIVAVDMFAANIEQVILGDARALLGGDVELSWRRAIPDTSREALNSLSERDILTSHVTELAAMAIAEPPEKKSRGGTVSQLVELKATDASYPLYGKVVAAPDQPLEQLLTPLPSRCRRSPCFGAIAQESLLIRLDLTVGSELRIGQARFIITAILKKEPDHIANGMSLGPRILISRQALEATELIRTGSRIQEKYRLKIPDSLSLEPLMGELRGRFSREGAQIHSFRDAQPRLKRFLDQLALYLGLIGLTILLVGGIGVACTIQGFITQKIPIIATLKTLGADSPQVIRLYLTQSLLLGGIGSLFGAMFGVALHQSVPFFLQGIIPETLPMHPALMPIIRGILLGTFATLAFSLWPLLDIRQVSPAWIFRKMVDPPQALAGTQSTIPRWRTTLTQWRTDRTRVLVSSFLVGSMAGLAVWQAHSLTLGLFFSVACGSAVLLLLGGTGLLYKGLHFVHFPQRYLLRHTMNNLRRPGNFTKAMTLAIGIGVMLMTMLITVQHSLLELINNQIPSNAPSFFFIDIQPDQHQQFTQVLDQHFPDSPFRLVPVMRSRLAAINEQPVNHEAHRGKRDGWYFTREYVLTASAVLPKDNNITRGFWWEEFKQERNSMSDGISSDLPLISVEEEAAQHLGLTIGSTLTLDIQGVPFRAQVSSFREVDWSSLSMNFFMIVEPGSLEGAPFTYIATARVPSHAEIPLQEAMVTAMPNVTAINVGDVLENIARIFRQLAMGIQALAWLCLMTGTVVMIAAISINRYRRLYELAILKALGGDRRLLLLSLGMEFGVIGAFAGLVGLGLGCVLSWAILHFFFDLTWTFDPALVLTGLFLTMVLTIVTGFLSTYRLLGFPPLSVLRQE